MADNWPPYLSRGQLAKLAQVQRAALSMWARRDPGFPQAVLVDGNEVLETRTILRWLDQRRIPRNSLQPDEDDGATYGDRVRRNLALDTSETNLRPTRPHAPRPPDEEAELWRTLDQLRGTMDLSQLRNLTLSLVFLRATDETGWAASRSAPHLDATTQLQSVRYRLQDEIDTVLPTLHDLPRYALPAIMHGLEALAHRHGNAATFRLLLEAFAKREGHRGREFYTPESVIRILVSMISMESASTIYDPACGSGELLVAAAARAREEFGSPDLSIHGAALNTESLAITRMNARLHDVAGDFELRPAGELPGGFGDTRRFSRILTNPPFNLRSWTDYDPYHRWRYGPPPKNNANFAWLQHAVERLAPGGQAAVVMPNGALFSASPREQDIRKGMLEDGCVEALISFPPGLFHSTGIPVTVWLLRPPNSIRNEILFIDASSAGHMVDRTRRELGDAEIREIAGIVDDWRARRSVEDSAIAVSVSLSKIRERGYNLSPSAHSSRPPIETRANTAALSVQQLTQRLDTEHKHAAAKDASADRVLKGLKW
jgi:type I restriction enzyme M protein